MLKLLQTLGSVTAVFVLALATGLASYLIIRDVKETTSL